MNLSNEADWQRIARGEDPKPAEDEREFVEIGYWLDRGTNEVLLFHVPTRQLFRKRFWMKSSSMNEGEVWLRFVGDRR